MRCVLIHKPGGHRQLQLEERPDPHPGPGELAVAVQACGVNFADCIVRMGLYASARKYVGWPITPGFELAGEVTETGPGVDDLQVGDAVFGVSRFGAYASRVVLPRNQVYRRPEQLTVEQAACFPTVFLTAAFALWELAHPRPGDRVLVHAAAGGVGSAALQLGRAGGLRMVGVVGREHKREVAEAMGADHVIVREQGDWWQMARKLAPEGWDVVLEPNGGRDLLHSYKLLGSPGKLVCYGFHSFMSRRDGRPPSKLSLLLSLLRTPRFDPLRMTNRNRSVLAFNLSYLFDRRELLVESMTRLLGLLASGDIRPLPTTSFPIEQVADAHRALESGQTTGKLVLTF